MIATTPLGMRIIEEKRRNGWGLEDLTVLAAINDPYRIDTPANHRDAQWLLEQMVRTPIHLRGLHYVLVAAADVVRPNGYDDACWRWLQANAADAARWLGYIPWDAIRDGRNEAPSLITRAYQHPPRVRVWFDFEIDIPADVDPVVYVDAFPEKQPYQILLIAEKSSVGEVLAPVARRFSASLATPTGEISDTMIHAIAEHMARDGRPAVCFYFADCDPSGYQMPVSFARKLQAFRDLRFPDINAQVFAAALTPEQVKSYGLPSTPLKDTERRSDRWQAAFGIEQTEIDALAALRPDLLRQIAEDAIAPFYDRSLRRRCEEARDEWEAAAKEAFDRTVDAERIEEMRDQYRGFVESLIPQIEEMRRAMKEEEVDVGDLGIGDFVAPEAAVDGAPVSPPIFDTGWDWSEASRRLKSRKAYGQ
jgi:hypothetical protein